MDPWDDTSRFADTVGQWPVLRQYAAGRVVCEIGVHFGGSSRTFLQAPCARLTSIEINPVPGVADELAEIAHEVGAPWKFIVGDSLRVVPPLCEVLFIDSLHTAAQLTAELVRYSPFVSEFILVHDTWQWGRAGESGGPGLCEAIDGFLEEEAAWKLREVVDIYPGLTVLERCDGVAMPNLSAA